MQEIGDVLIGAIFVLISAAGRFNTPPTNRASTTALRYYTAFFCYLFVGMGLYFGLLSFRPLLDGLKAEAGFFGGLAKEFSSAPLVALLLTVLLPKIPLLAEGDAWIRESLQRMGSIPYEARRLASELHKAKFLPSPSLRQEITMRLVNEGFQADDLLFEESTSLKHIWTKASSLVIQIEDWENDRRFTGFVDRFAQDLNTLKERYRRLRPKIRNYFNYCRLTRDLPTGGGSRNDDLLNQVYADLTEQSTEVLNDLYSFISRGLLLCGVTYSARSASLAMLGFDVRTVKLKPRLTLNHMMMLFGMVGIAVLTVFMLLGIPSGLRFEEILARVVMISVIYSAAVICAVYPKERWAFARRDLRSIRPVAFYFVAGILAIIVSWAISLLFDLALFQSWTWASGHFQLTYPWALCSFVAAFAVSWMIDDEPTPILTRNRLRWIESLMGAVTLVPTVWIVFLWLDQLAGNHNQIVAHRSPLSVALVMSAAIGLTIGYLIPTWYREAPREGSLVPETEPVDRIQPAVAGA